ncbi:MAG TPA: translation initiation factor IF-2 [Bryobacteraceae bacterium]|nr:translation initiation factor IF-2 [Bryobacteraceae bacterium]
MSKIRINELARELEVKPNVILETLAELGIADKKTHSSSLDDDVALQVRFRVTGESPSAAPAVSRHAETRTESAAQPEPAREQPSPKAPAAKTESPAAETGTASVKEAPQAKTAEEAPAAPVRLAPPLRPPLSSGQFSAPTIPHSPPSIPHSPPSIPLPHPTTPRAAPQAPPPAPAHAPAPPVAHAPAAPSMPVPASPAPAAPRGSAIPARPMPAPRPGQILSGPRQPLPAGVGDAPRIVTPGVTSASPGAPRPAAPSVPSIPAPPRPQTMRPGAPSQASPSQPLRPPAKPNLAGQPQARPVVPPRPDMVARLSTRPPTPGAPPPPRPGMPTRPASPVPGRPIYTGPVRPGQPLMRGPGGPPSPGGYNQGGYNRGPGGPGAPGGYNRGPGGPGGPAQRGRPMHPTSPLRAEPATLPTDPGRRHATKPGTRTPADRRRDQDEGRMRGPISRREQSFEPPPIDREVTIAEGITVKELSEKLGVKGNLVVKRLFDKKISATINQTLDVKVAEELARDFGASTNKVSYEQETTHEIETTEVDLDRERRPPVVTIMGHVDHGKTSLLDAIREAHVADHEAGGITQHIGAYHVEKNGRKIVFIDTPGHEAFTRMRARGAKVTDIVILVVAADDGVMPQTLEAIDHAKAAKVPIIVAINKIDKPGAQPERIKQQLADRGLQPEDWGGDVVMVPVSARAKTNLDLLLEMILLVADMLDLKANPARPAMGTVLEAKLDRGRGPVATVLVRNGTLRVGDYMICGSVFGRVRAMVDDHGENTREVGPSMPAEVQGLESLPDVGDTMQVVTDTAKAKQIVIYRESKAREVAMAKNKRLTLDQFHDQLKEGEVKDLNIILKTDVGGTAEVIADTLTKLSTDKVRVRVMRAGVGAITETDVLLASASNAIIIGFNVRPDRTAQSVAEQEKVDIRLHSIIYELVDQIKKAMSGMLDPVFRDVYKGRAVVQNVFRISKVGAVAGCVVQDGVITRNSEVRVLRDNVLVHTGKIEGLKRFKNDASEVKAGFECGISLANFNDVKEGDVFECFATERVAQEALV